MNIARKDILGCIWFNRIIGMIMISQVVVILYFGLRGQAYLLLLKRCLTNNTELGLVLKIVAIEPNRLQLF